MSRWGRLFLMGLLLVASAACAAPLSPEKVPQPMPPEAHPAVATLEGAKLAEEPVRGFPATGAFKAKTSLPTERRIVYEANLVLVVTDTERAAQQIIDETVRLGGYVANASLYRVDSEIRGTITVRVPQERFEEALSHFRQLAVRVDREERRTQDVTAEYVDLEARLKNLEATEEELRNLLREVRQRTQKASEIMEVYRELTRVREEIETIKGRLQMLERLTAYATITVELVPHELTEPVTQPWDPRVTLRRAWAALLRVGQILVDAAIYVVVVGLPVAVVVALPVGLVVMGIRRWRRSHTG